MTHSFDRHFFHHGQRPVNELELRMRDSLGGLRELLLAECHTSRYPGLEILDISPLEASTEPAPEAESDLEAAG